MYAYEHCTFGFRLLRTIPAHEAEITAFSWRAGKEGERDLLFSASTDCTLSSWDRKTGQRCAQFVGHTQAVDCIALSPDRQTLISGSWDQSIRFWCIDDGRQKAQIMGHEGSVWQLAVLENESLLASSSSDKTIKLWDLNSLKACGVLTGHKGAVYWVCSLSISNTPCLASASSDKSVILWDVNSLTQLAVINFDAGVHSLVASHDGKYLFAGAEDGSISIIDTSKAKRLKQLKVHRAAVKSLSLSCDGSVLVSRSIDGQVRFLRTPDLETCAILSEPYAGAVPAGLALHPESWHLASLADNHRSIRIWEISPKVLLGKGEPSVLSAPVVFLGDSGSGKTALSNALSGFSFQPTESTHGRALNRVEIKSGEGRDGDENVKELVFWDLAGQPAYRSLHPIYFPKAAVVVIVFDPRSEAAPEAGIRYWSSVIRLLRLEMRAQENCRIVLCAARCDLLNLRPDSKTLEQLMKEEGIEGVAFVSAKSGQGLQELYQLIADNIDWRDQAKVLYTPFLRTLRILVWEEGRNGLDAISIDELKDKLLEQAPQLDISVKQLTVGLSELAHLGLLRILPGGQLILLRPKVFDDISALIAEKALEMNGRLCVADLFPLVRQYYAHLDQHISDEILKSVISSFLSSDIAVENVSEGEILFPSFARNKPPQPIGPRMMSWSFASSPAHIYNTLSVRLARMVELCLLQVWKNAALYGSREGGEGQYLLSLTESAEDRGELSLYCNSGPAQAEEQETADALLSLISADLSELALEGSVRAYRPACCPLKQCSFELEHELQRKLFVSRIERISCPRCGSLVCVGGE